MWYSMRIVDYSSSRRFRIFAGTFEYGQVMSRMKRIGSFVGGHDRRRRCSMATVVSVGGKQGNGKFKSGVIDLVFNI
jgi:hypothetical protein